jgi:sugar phosphate isomerase/epimerase
MKNLINLLFVTLLCGSIPATTVHAGEETAAEQAGWRLGVQAYTFRAITFMETVDKVQALGLKYIEMYPGQKLKPGSNVKTGPDMSESDVAEVQAKLKAAGVRIIAFGVAPLPTNAAAARLRFEWAKKMGIEVLVTETTPNAMLDQLSGEFGIKIALHNHPKTWPPEKVLEATKSLSKRIGSCSDTGHWKRAGLDPVATLKQLEGRIVHVHFKDVVPVGEKADKWEDAPWGTGRCDAPGMLAELKRQGYQGYFIIEYEHGTVDELMNDLPQCARFFNETAARLAPAK